jgi:hypothetical protein
MGVALDAMRQLGFEENLVRKTIQELLDVMMFMMEYKDDSLLKMLLTSY